MTTRAEQINILLAGLRGLDDAPLLRGTVYFYAAGTSNAKNVWTEKEKTNPFTSVTLDSFGAKQIYGDGIYKLVVKDADGNTIHTWDNFKIQATTFTLSTKTDTYSATSDDDVVLADTDGGAFDVDLAAASTFERPLIIKNIGSSSNDATIDPNGAETIDGSANLAVADGVAVEIFTDGTTWYSAQSHSTTHERGGADEINGDHLDIDFTPTYYTPATTPAEAAHVDDLAAHLYGIDNLTHALTRGATDVTASATEVNTACDGSTAKNSHTHLVAGGATDVTASAAEINTAADGDTARNNHVHSNLTLTGGTGIDAIGDLSASRTINHTAHTGAVTGSTALTIAADGVGPPEIEDGITHLIANDDNMTQISTTATSFTTQLNFSLFIPASAQWMHINALLDNVAVKVTYLRFTCGGATSGTADVTGIGAAWADTDADISAESGWTACTIDMYTSDGGFAALLNAYTIVLKHAT